MVFPLLRVTVDDFKLLRHRRCNACIHVTAKMQDKPLTKITDTKEDDTVASKHDTEHTKQITEDQEADIKDQQIDNSQEIVEVREIVDPKVAAEVKEAVGIKEADSVKEVIQKTDGVVKSTVPENKRVMDEHPKLPDVYDAVAIVRCLLELDLHTHTFKCAEVEDVATKDFMIEYSPTTKRQRVLWI